MKEGGKFNLVEWQYMILIQSFFHPSRSSRRRLGEMWPRSWTYLHQSQVQHSPWDPSKSTPWGPSIYTLWDPSKSTPRDPSKLTLRDPSKSTIPVDILHEIPVSLLREFPVSLLHVIPCTHVVFISFPNQLIRYLMLRYCWPVFNFITAPQYIVLYTLCEILQLPMHINNSILWHIR